MSSGVRRLSGEEWQAFADQLLVRRYGPAQYQKVPAKDSGMRVLRALLSVDMPIRRMGWLSR